MGFVIDVHLRVEAQPSKAGYYMLIQAKSRVPSILGRRISQRILPEAKPLSVDAPPSK